MIDRDHALPLTAQARQLGISRGWHRQHHHRSRHLRRRGTCPGVRGSRARPDRHGRQGARRRDPRRGGERRQDAAGDRDDTACGDRKPEVWVVDEASMMGARDAKVLLAQAQAEGARLVLVEDVAELGSVETGRSFGQLQDAGMATFKLEEIVCQSNARTREAVEAMFAGDAAKAFAALDAGGGRIVEQPDTQTRQAVLAGDFAALSREDRARTLVLDPTRQGRQELTDAIRAALVTDGTLGKDAMVASVLESRPSAGISHRVEAVDAATGTVRLLPNKRPRQRAEPKPIDWQSARWGADQAEAFTEVEHEFRAGDRLQFTRNNYRAGRLNGHTAKVVAIDPAGSSMVVARDDGRREMLDMNHLADRHVRHGWVRTIHSAQGATCDRVLAHVESYRANIVDARAVYVAISRARKLATLYTDSRADLTEALGLRDGAQVARSIRPWRSRRWRRSPPPQPSGQWGLRSAGESGRHSAAAPSADWRLAIISATSPTVIASSAMPKLTGSIMASSYFSQAAVINS